MNNQTSPLLDSADEIAIAGTIHFFARNFGKELGDQVNTKISSTSSSNWFAVLRNARKSAGHVIYDDFRDPRFLLKEALDENGIVHFGISGFDADWKISAAYLRRKLNYWFHGSLEPNLETFIKIIELILDLAHRSQLPLEKSLIKALERARQIELGNYNVKIPALAPSASPEITDLVQKISDKKASIEKRPPIGAEWTGPKGTRKIVISKKLHDVTENGVSIKNQLGQDPESVIDDWLRYYPLGGEAKVAEDGAVMGFKLGQAYLIGWLGQEIHYSNVNQTQGFVLPYEYLFTHGDIREIASGKLLSRDSVESAKNLISKLADNLKEGDFFNATPYGELIIQSETGEPVILATVHKDIWFKGHLPG